jgi:oxygen-independent coproporphyrinogen-3 oxidase
MTALYVHIPYCRSKCPYCDFVSIPLDTSVGAYLRALIKEAASAPEAFRPVETLYIGGGTPTVLSTDQICRLFENLRKIFQFSTGAEITVEANPCSLNRAKAEAMAANGVNRVSLGIQSFIDSELQMLGRQHTVQEAIQGSSLLRETGIDNLSLDLIYGIPNQSLKDWQYSLSQAIALKPAHISAYCLTYEPHTPLWHSLQKCEIEKQSDEEELLLYEAAREMLTQAGYEHYEISNFALPGKRSKHNTIYWSNEEYLGLGAGAFSYIDEKRIANLREPEEYIEAVENRGSAACEIEEISPHMQAVETILQRLRLREGIDCRAFAERFGVHPEHVLSDSLSELVELELIEKTPGAIRPRLKGWHLANEVALKILP